MKGRFVKFLFSIILFLTMVLPESSVHAAMETTVKEIMANKDSY